MSDELARKRGPWLAAVHQALHGGVESGAFPGGACAVYQRGELLHLSVAGDAQVQPPFRLRYRFGGDSLDVGWAILLPRPSYAAH